MSRKKHPTQDLIEFVGVIALGLFLLVVFYELFAKFIRWMYLQD
jgi:hypothetical protein